MWGNVYRSNSAGFAHLGEPDLHTRKFDLGVSGQFAISTRLTKHTDFAFRAMDNLGLVNTRKEKGWSPTKTNTLNMHIGIIFH
jgi:hypothetical protein